MIPITLQKRIEASPQLTAMARAYREEPKPPNSTSTIVRSPPPLEDPEQLGEQIMRQNRELMHRGFLAAGISEDIVKKIQGFDGLATNAAEFLVASLDMSHRMMIYLAATMLERAEFIRREYLDDATLDPEQQIKWQMCYTDIVEQVGRAYDRTLQGTQAMAKMIGTDNPKPEKRKPGFSALKRAENEPPE